MLPTLTYGDIGQHRPLPKIVERQLNDALSHAVYEGSCLRLCRTAPAAKPGQHTMKTLLTTQTLPAKRVVQKRIVCTHAAARTSLSAHQQTQGQGLILYTKSTTTTATTTTATTTTTTACLSACVVRHASHSHSRHGRYCTNIAVIPDVSRGGGSLNQEPSQC